MLHYEYKELFEKASKAKTTQELDTIIEEESGISTIINEFEDKYPPIDLTVQNDAVSLLITEGIINSDHTINLAGENRFSTFEKLLLAVLWKNGHIMRIQPILDGITGIRKSNSDFGVIFRQFGRSLVDPEEPIVDQHVLRAFSAYGDLSEVKGRRKVPRKVAFKESDQELINAYRAWFKSVLHEVPTEQKTKFKYRLDKLLFALGKGLE
jgi:hypothetical protein